MLNRFWWFWRSRVLGRRRAAAVAEAQARELALTMSGALPDDAITGAIRSLPEAAWGERALASDVAESAQDECRLCLEEYKCGEMVRTLPCGHCYHSKCIDVWLAGYRQQGLPRGQRGCPLCKRDPLQGVDTVQRHHGVINGHPDVTFFSAIQQYLLTGDVRGHVVMTRRQQRPGADVQPSPTGRRAAAASPAQSTPVEPFPVAEDSPDLESGAVQAVAMSASPAQSTPVEPFPVAEDSPDLESGAVQVVAVSVLPARSTPVEPFPVAADSPDLERGAVQA